GASAARAAAGPARAGGTEATAAHGHCAVGLGTYLGKTGRAGNPGRRRARLEPALLVGAERRLGPGSAGGGRASGPLVRCQCRAATVEHLRKEETRHQRTNERMSGRGSLGGALTRAELGLAIFLGRVFGRSLDRLRLGLFEGFAAHD